jgi:hypothetical protein
MTEVSLTGPHVINQFGESTSILNLQAAFAFIAIGANYRKFVKFGIGSR